jgi:hypothetical protein
LIKAGIVLGGGQVALISATGLAAGARASDLAYVFLVFGAVNLVFAAIVAAGMGGGEARAEVPPRARDWYISGLRLPPRGPLAPVPRSDRMPGAIILSLSGVLLLLASLAALAAGGALR